jgi:hypothetical protein
MQKGTVINRRFRDPALPVCTLDEVTSLRTPINNIADIMLSKLGATQIILTYAVIMD